MQDTLIPALIYINACHNYKLILIILSRSIIYTLSHVVIYTETHVVVYINLCRNILVFPNFVIYTQAHNMIYINSYCYKH